MITHRVASVVAVLAVLMLGSACSAEPVRRTANVALAEVDSVVGPGVTAGGRVQSCMALLTQEMQAPSIPCMGIAGGPVDTGYVQEVIMGCVCTWAQKDDERASIRTALKTEAASISDPAMQDRLAVMLGYSGDHSVVSTLVRILESEPAGVVRHSAALALDRLSDPASIPALKQALRDDTYARVRSGGCIGPRYSGAQACYSPVRAAAAQALRRMGQSVAADAELVDAKYVVPRLTPLLESSAQPFEALAWLAGLGPDGQKAIEAFIAAEKATPSDAKVVEFAQAVLVLARSRQTQEPQQAPTIAAGN